MTEANIWLKRRVVVTELDDIEWHWLTVVRQTWEAKTDWRTWQQNLDHYIDEKSGRIDSSNTVETRYIVGGRDEHWYSDRHQVLKDIVDVVLVNDNRLQLDFAEIHHRQSARVTVRVDSRSDTKARRRQGNNKVIMQIGRARYGMINVCSATRCNLPHHSKTSSCV